MQVIWNSEDYRVGLCTAAQIGEVREAQSAPSKQETKKTYAEKLHELSEQAVDAVLDHPQGAKAWFKENPQAHVKVLVKLATPHVPDQNVNLSVEVSWLSKDRLSYKGDKVIDAVSPIEDAKVLDALSRYARRSVEGAHSPK